MSYKINNGGPAFPNTGDDWHYSETALTKRQWYAGMALQALIDPKLNELHDTDGYGRRKLTPAQDAAQRAFAYADAMIAAEQPE
ncbi:hypothetical protein [Roseicella sp. DB1501]|uniref:hypothetical protein n=1 Tax=Roseicella sp. DB1501 TaxID=2730925 RepID=UPI001490A4F1|nr:hypothetical protein [Roseicella sp. DB1501]NOG70451.1 hypothetical protein [Roseicella sp. DB1501]